MEIGSDRYYPDSVSNFITIRENEGTMKKKDNRLNYDFNTATPLYSPSNPEKKIVKKKPIIITCVSIIFFVLLLALIFKTTLVASTIACISEKPDNYSDYITFQLLPSKKNFISYKKSVTTQIREDKATKVREQQIQEREELISQIALSCTEQLVSAFSYETLKKKEADTAEDLKKFMEKCDLPAISECDKYKDLLESIATSVHYAMASDSYYNDISSEEISSIMDPFISTLNTAKPVRQLQIEQISPGEYDPEPQKDLAKRYKTVLEKCQKANTQKQYDYIASDQTTFSDKNGEKLLTIKNIYAIGKSDYALLLTEMILPHKYVKVLPHGTLYYYGDTNTLETPATPFIINEDEMRTKADIMATDFKKIWSLDGKTPEYAQAVNNICAKASSELEAVEENNAADAEESADESEVSSEVEDAILDECSNLENEITNKGNEIKSYLATEFDQDSEWGSIVFLESCLYNAQNLFYIYAQDKSNSYLNQTNDQLTDEQKAELQNWINQEEQLLLYMPDPLFVTEEEVQDMDYSTFETEYTAQTGKDLPTIIKTKAFTYSYENIGTMKITNILTPVGVFITNIEWIAEKTEEDNAILSDMSQDLYTLPNLPKMEAEAKNAIHQEDYPDETSYNAAINNWLYEHYPDYYENPNQASDTSSSSSAPTSFYYHSTLDKFVKDTSRTISSIYEDIGYITEGTILGYLFTPNGSFRSFADDVSDAASDVIQELRDTKDAIKYSIKSWWNSLYW